MIEQFKSRQFFLFLLTGGAAATVNFFSRLVYNLWVDFPLAIIFAYLTGMLTAYVLAKLFVFKHSSQSAKRSIIFFVLVNFVAITQTWVISMGLAQWVLPLLGVNKWTHEIAHAIGVAVPVFTSYVGHKQWSFK